MVGTSRGDIEGMVAVLRQFASSAASREPNEGEMQVAALAAVDLLAGALVNLSRIADALEAAASKG